MDRRLNVLIPVYNGALVLGETITQFVSESAEFLNLVVVVNGSSDDSMGVAEVALKAIALTGASVHLVHLGVASRTEALNLGHEFTVPSGHHLYLDQDVRVSPGGLAKVVQALDDGAQFVAARAVWRTPSRMVRAAMEAWNCLPYVRGTPVTAGMYAVSAHGRARWGEWPVGLPDDKFARLHFFPEERVGLDDVEYSALAPADLSALVAARTRYARYNRNLRESTPSLADKDSGRGIENLVGFPAARLPGLVVLAAVELVAQFRARF